MNDTQERVPYHSKPKVKAEELESAKRRAWNYAHDCGPDDARFTAELAKQIASLPVFDLYDLKVAAPLVGKSYDALAAFLKNHREKFPPRYRTYPNAQGRARLVRVLTAREILEIRTYTLKGPGRFTQ